MLQLATQQRPEFNLELDYLGRPKIFMSSYLGNVGSLNRMLANYKNMQYVNAPARKQGNHTPLHFACYGSANLATIIVLTKSCRANCLAFDNVGRTPFHLACNSADPEIVDFFIDNLKMSVLLNTADFNGRTPIHALCCSGSSKTEKRRGQSLLDSFNLLMECYRSDSDKVAALTRKDNFGLTPVMLAKFYGFEELYASFAKLGIDLCSIPEIDSQQPGVMLDYFGRTKLMEAAFDNDLLLVKDLLANKDASSNPNLANRQAGYRTPLLLACCSGQEGIVDVVAAILADDRANPLVTDIDHSNALHFATYTGRDDVVKFLLSKPRLKQQINIADIYGMTPLHTLALSSKREIMRLESLNELLKNGADLFAVDNVGRTAYDIAVMIGNEVVAQRLFIAMCTYFKNGPTYGGGNSPDGFAPRLIAFERHILNMNVFPDSTIPLVEKVNYYHYGDDETKVVSKLRTIYGR